MDQRHVSKLKHPKLSPSDESDLFEAAIIMPEIDDDVPMPKNREQAIPEMSTEQELEVRANTIKTVADLNGVDISPSQRHQEQARELAREMMTNNKLKPEFAQYPNETTAYLAGLVAQMDVSLVEEMATYKNYIINNAVRAHEVADSVRDKIAALRMLGDIDGIDAFKKKTEITHINKTGKELEEELKKTIEELKGKMIEGEHTIIEEDEDD